MKNWLLLLVFIVLGCANPNVNQNYGAVNKDDSLTTPNLGKQEEASVQYILGLTYENGIGVPKDYVQAASWYRKAAVQGYTEAQYHLGWMYATGNGVPKNDAQAASWLRKAADQGYAEAQFILGLMYAKGDGVPRNDELAYFWWLLSSGQGHEDAAKYRDLVEEILTPQQRANTQASATNWKPK